MAERPIKIIHKVNKLHQICKSKLDLNPAPRKHTISLRAVEVSVRETVDFARLNGVPSKWRFWVIKITSLRGRGLVDLIVNAQPKAPAATRTT